jgi:hypothetical protein
MELVLFQDYVEKESFHKKTANFHYSLIINSEQVSEALGFFMFLCEVFKTFHFHLVSSCGEHKKCEKLWITTLPNDGDRDVLRNLDVYIFPSFE